MNERKRSISASMMCSDLLDLKETIEIFEKNNIERLHIDVMDGIFVPNYGLGVDYIRGLRDLTSIPLDLHLMITEPENKLQRLGIRPTDMVSIHYESTSQIQRALDYLHDYGCRCFIAINPATPVFQIEEILDFIDGINLLMVNPGFAGQKMVPSTMKKAEKLMNFLVEMNKTDIEVEADGNITPEAAHTLSSLGASIFVAGSSSIFRGGIAAYNDNIKLFREKIELV